jgi:hypothetical protein
MNETLTIEERCIMAKEKGYYYNQETGKIYNKKGIEIISKTNNGYIRLCINDDKKRYYIKAHQFAWYWVNKECVQEIDHINGIKEDNRISNLRSVTHQENNWNRINAKGYYWSKACDKWHSQISVNSRKIHLGFFEKEEDARDAYLQAKEKYHKITFKEINKLEDKNLQKIMRLIKRLETNQKKLHKVLKKQIPDDENDK